MELLSLQTLNSGEFFWPLSAGKLLPYCKTWIIFISGTLKWSIFEFDLLIPTQATEVPASVF